MANKDLRFAKKIIRRKPVLSVIFMVFLSILLLAAIAVTFAVTTDCIVLAKLTNQIDAVTEIYDIEDKGSKLLEQNNADYFVTDSEGNIVSGNKDNTCQYGTQALDLNFMFIKTENEYKIYADDMSDFLTAEEDEDSGIIALEFVNNQLVASEMEEKGYIEIPFWIAYPQEASGKLVVKAAIKITQTDLLAILITTALFAVIATLLMVLVLVFGISNIINQSMIRKTLFMDRVSLGHNWIWFLVRSSNILKRHGNLKCNFAVVNLVFVKYRNYVLCHSKTEGEKMLSMIYSIIAANIGRNNIVAHSTEAHFPMLIKYQDVNDLRLKLQGIISKLEKIDKDHKFGFQAGVDLIPPQSRKERKNLDMDVIYNNASAARLQLEDKDISGIRFYDTKLLEDNKWIDRVTEKQHEALAKEEFAVYYQPKYDPNTNELLGAEALIRWISEDLGFVAPGRFIPIFESNGFITEIDHYMLSHVARDQAKWISQGYNIVPVSVNVSRAHFIEDDLAEQIRDICIENGCPAEYIEIELTESAFFDDKDKMISTIKKLQSYGFAVSMDDFGSGYSSLNSLKDLPLNILKLDAGFFKEGEDLQRSEVVVSEAIRLAKNLNMKTVAEGIEEKPQVDFLAKEGCDMIQGYYFAKPMPGSDYEQKMNKTNLSSGEASDTPGHSE